MKHFHRSYVFVVCLLGLVLMYAVAGPYARPAIGAPAYQAQPMVSHVLRYRSSEASEVSLVWGVNGWHMLPEMQRPAKTTIVKTISEVMQTPMTRVNDMFEVTVQAPQGSIIDYVFHITRSRSGVNAEAWDLNGVPERDFHVAAEMNGVTEVASTISLGQQLLLSTADASLQWVSTLVLAGATLLIGFAALNFYMRNPYLDF